MQKLPLRLIHIGNSTQLLLGDLDITSFVARDGLRIEYVDQGGLTYPEVTITFAPGRLDLDLDIELLEHLLEAARRLVTG